MTSAEFRKSYARLIAPTVVTVLGRPIGTWIPTGTENTVVVTDSTGTKMEGLAVRQPDVPFNTRPFTPVPKVAPKR